VYDQFIGKRSMIEHSLGIGACSGMALDARIERKSNILKSIIHLNLIALFWHLHIN
jgi:hypothetical protein